MCRGHHIVTGSPVLVFQIYEPTLILGEWKSEIKFQVFSIVYWHFLIWKHILKSDLDFWILLFQVHSFICLSIMRWTQFSLMSKLLSIYNSSFRPLKLHTKKLGQDNTFFFFKIMDTYILVLSISLMLLEHLCKMPWYHLVWIQYIFVFAFSLKSYIFLVFLFSFLHYIVLCAILVSFRFSAFLVPSGEKY